MRLFPNYFGISCYHCAALWVTVLRQRDVLVLKVAETMFNPFGEDDDDYEMNMFIDKYMKVCSVILMFLPENCMTLFRYIV